MYFGVAVVYFAGGYMYNNKVYGLSGREACPHSQFWFVDLQGLVTDGCYYSLDVIKVKFPHKRAICPRAHANAARRRYTLDCTSVSPARSCLRLPNTPTLARPHSRLMWIRTELSNGSLNCFASCTALLPHAFL